ncbi:MAG TPA: MBL fold metallo-hydrolase [Candidatus Levybacteria bacterium]|nr:MBL fold metallo-hydrolase [Candidatus Levybacteria bacterium]
MENITWFAHASFLFVDKDSGGEAYYVDPFQLPKNKDIPKADVIFITHAHYDHFSALDINRILKNETIVVATPDCLNALVIKLQKFPVEPSRSYDIRGFHFETIPAYNVRPDRLSFHPQKNKWVGYIFELYGQLIYHAGDTDFIPEMRELAERHLDVALLPMGGTYTMDVSEMISATKAIKPKNVIPMHYKTLLGGAAYKGEQQIRAELKDSRVVILEEFR